MSGIRYPSSPWLQVHTLLCFTLVKLWAKGPESVTQHIGDGKEMTGLWQHQSPWPLRLHLPSKLMATASLTDTTGQHGIGPPVTSNSCKHQPS